MDLICSLTSAGGISNRTGIISFSLDVILSNLIFISSTYLKTDLLP